jgi:hypothetical protein
MCPELPTLRVRWEVKFEPNRDYWNPRDVRVTAIKEHKGLEVLEWMQEDASAVTRARLTVGEGLGKIHTLVLGHTFICEQETYLEVSCLSLRCCRST